jgi:diadenosine tetraphosphatase ApaH/serine/threonine PP2A family protein phosphatase
LNQLTVFGDIHANLHALDAALRDMGARGLGGRHCLGDLVGYGVFPNEVVERIRGLGAPTLMGNYDEGVGRSSPDCGCAYTRAEDEERGRRSIAWTNAHTTAEHKAYLRALPAHIPLRLGELRVLLVHGSPRRVNEYLFEDRPPRSLERLLDLAEADVLVCGHTHLPYHRVLPSGRHVVNAGSVGKPKDGDPRACYVTLEARGGDLAAEFIRVEYDVEAAARAIEATDMPHEYADMLRAGAG